MNKTRPIFAFYQDRIIPFDEVMIPATDASLEHGVGLFESIRAESGRIPLWEYHIQRLGRSTEELHIPFNSKQLPSAQILDELLEQSGLKHQSARLRLVLTAGSGTGASRLWLTAHPLSPVKQDGLMLAPYFWPVDPRDELVKYKTLNYWARRRAFESASVIGADEILSQDFDGHIWEGSRSSLLLVKNGAVIAPEVDGPYLRSVAAQAITHLLETENQIEIRRKRITTNDLESADEVLLANAVRGVQSVSRWNSVEYTSPGPVAKSLRSSWQSRYF